MPVAVGQLRQLGDLLLDIHGQNDGRKLLDEGRHRAYLDRFAGLDGALSDYAAVFTALRDKQAEIDALVMDEGEKARRIDTLQFQLEELDRAEIRPGEYEEISQRRALMKNAARLTEALAGALEALTGSDDSFGAASLLRDAGDMVSDAEEYAGSLNGAGEKLRSLAFDAEDIAEQIRDVLFSLEFSPDEMDRLDARLDQLRRLMKKYGDSEEELITYREKIRAELETIEMASSRIEKLTAERESLQKTAWEKAKALSDLRRKAALRMTERIREELSALSMPGVQFEVQFSPVRADGGLSAFGCDEVRFLMSANAGEAPGRISQIASGGELSRIMLALKNVLSENEDIDTLVFDEVDAGVSGIAAQRVAEKLATLSAHRQVLCVTHLPQIAAMADTHFEIKKETKSGRTYTSVTLLDEEGRRRELARLIGGENVTPTTLLSAGEQLDAAGAFKAALKTK
jgi:DNA repair protein RecN (Recombination protein N)